MGSLSTHLIRLVLAPEHSEAKKQRLKKPSKGLYRHGQNVRSHSRGTGRGSPSSNLSGADRARRRGWPRVVGPARR